MYIDLFNSLPDLTYFGLLLLAQKSAGQFGDGEGSLAFWKNSMADYHDEKKVFKFKFFIFSNPTHI